jgi:hypothetical protein
MAKGLCSCDEFRILSCADWATQIIQCNNKDPYKKIKIKIRNGDVQHNWMLWKCYAIKMDRWAMSQEYGQSLEMRKYKITFSPVPPEGIIFWLENSLMPELWGNKFTV